MLKADLHIHTKEDPCDVIRYSARAMIKYKAKLGFNVLAITNHNSVYYNKELKDYAKKLDVLLIPSMEALVEGREVLLLGVEGYKSWSAYDGVKKKYYRSLYKSLDILSELREEGVVVGAPHPYFVVGQCLGNKLIENIENIDYIEYSHFYNKFLNRNNKAVEVAKRFKKPLIASTDAHHWFQLGIKNYSYIDAEQNVDDVLEAIRKGKVEICSKPLSIPMFSKILATAIKWKTVNTFSKFVDNVRK